MDETRCETPARSTTMPRRWAAWLKLAVCSGALAGVWLFVLPWMATIPPVAEHISRMEQKNINVDAMFYTELEWEPPDGAAWR